MIFIKTKVAGHGSRFLFRHLFASQKLQNITQQFRIIMTKIDEDSPSTNRNDLRQFTSKLKQLIKQDSLTQPAFSQYPLSMQGFSLLIEALGPTSLTWDTSVIKQNTQLLSEVYSQITSYPVIELRPDVIMKSHQIFCQGLNLKNDEQLNGALVFTLRADGKAEQSVEYGEFLKFYLRSSSEILKAKYQISLKDENVGSFFKKIFGKIVQRGFLRRTPDYDRNLTILYPLQTLSALLNNKSTCNSLLIRKIFYSEIFLKIRHFFENIMHNNIYNTDKTNGGLTIWQYINQQHFCQCLFHENRSPLIEEQAQYIRELYVTLLLVLDQQNKVGEIVRYCGNLVAVYNWLKVNRFDIQSQKASQFVNKVTAMFQKRDSETEMRKYLNLCHELFYLPIHFSNLNSLACQKIQANLTPLTFRLYFQKILTFSQILIKNNEKHLLMKLLTILSITQVNMNNSPDYHYFTKITLDECQAFARLLSQIGKEQELEIVVKSVYQKLIEGIVNRDYNYEKMGLSDVIKMLGVYAYHQVMPNSINQMPEMKELRLFLFRYIADNYQNHQNWNELEQLLKYLILIDDCNSFDDEHGNYNLTIFQQLKPFLTQITTDSLISLQTRGGSAELTKMIKWIKNKYYLEREESVDYWSLAVSKYFDTNN